MALTINLSQISTSRTPGIGFYSRLQNLSSGLYYDTGSGTLLPLANASPNINFTESPPGSGSWTWTLNLSLLPDGLYQITSYEATQNLPAADSQEVFLVGGETKESISLAQVAVNHNTGGTDNLRYIDLSSNPIVGAVIRIYTTADWNAQALSNPVGITSTDAAGRWLQPIFVSVGATYFVQFSLTGQFGPDVMSITV